MHVPFTSMNASAQFGGVHIPAPHFYVDQKDSLVSVLRVLIAWWHFLVRMQAYNPVRYLLYGVPLLFCACICLTRRSISWMTTEKKIMVRGILTYQFGFVDIDRKQRMLSDLCCLTTCTPSWRECCTHQEALRSRPCSDRQAPSIQFLTFQVHIVMPDPHRVCSRIVLPGDELWFQSFTS